MIIKNPSTSQFIAGQEGSYFVSASPQVEERNRLWCVLIEIVNLDTATKFLAKIEDEQKVSKSCPITDLYRAVRHVISEPRIHPGDELITLQNLMPAWFSHASKAVDQGSLSGFRMFVRSNHVTPRDFVSLMLVAQEMEAA